MFVINNCIKRQVLMSGGLGNQMFEYALVLALRERGFETYINTKMFQNVTMHNGYELPHVFGISEPRQGNFPYWCVRLLDRLGINNGRCKDPVIEYTGDVFKQSSILYTGCWINEAYFRDIREKILCTYRFQSIDTVNYGLSEQMQRENSVSIHIRRGDYLKLDIYNVCDELYYSRAITMILEKIQNPVFYVFSDDPLWCENFMKKMGCVYKIISHNKGVESYKDMYLMSKCKNNIIANSTFSWWGAWLNNHANKFVIAPNQWFRGETKSPVCKGWIRI